uniref:GOST seven transmembrane domain-containing protein n=1 Tax=Picocystis salinarum TaxID=88271 RepID=A0A7S3UDB9_9CHLO|mmetsp:Transcript_727/g.4609  ORF Transcript_727/g.4609 Transcript_727/m.4609 type:complete len:500 (-) Transcript_727:258-1757(-)
MDARTTMSHVLRFMAVLATLGGRGTQAATHRYRGTELEAVGDELRMARGGREGVRAEEGKTSYVKTFDVVMRRAEGESSDKSGTLHALVFALEDYDRLGRLQTKNGVQRRAYCCREESDWRDEEGEWCTPGQLLLGPPNPERTGWPKDFTFKVEAGETELHLKDLDVPIKQTGMYYLWFLSCDPALDGATITGKSVWKNPTGYLPGMMAPNLPFFGVMSILYVALGAIWLLVYAINWKEVVMVQHCISAVILLGMVETMVWYLDYENFNRTGERPYLTTLVAIVLGCLRKTLARFLVLAVSMGYGVVKPTLAGLQQRVLALCGAYLLFSLSLEIATNLGAVDDMVTVVRLMLVVPVSIIDSLFILWIFTSLSRTLSQVHSRKQTAKLDLYRNFTNMIAITVVVSLFWIIYEMYFRISDSINVYWENEWVNGAFWHMLNFLVLCGICFLWRPSQQAARFAFVAERDEEEAVALTGGQYRSDQTDIFVLEAMEPQEPEKHD